MGAFHVEFVRIRASVELRVEQVVSLIFASVAQVSTLQGMRVNFINEED